MGTFLLIWRASVVIVSFAALGLSGSTAAAEQTKDVVRSHLEQIVAVRDVRVDSDQVSGVLVNLSNKGVHHVRILVTRSWLWAHERHPGAPEDNPGHAAFYTVPGEIPPGGQLSFTHQGTPPLPQRSDGHFETSVSVVGLDQEG